MCGKTAVSSRSVAWAGIMGGVALGGCQNAAIVAPPRDLPPELAFVVENETRFIADPDDPLWDVLPGTVMDDLSGLSGCWGAALLSPPRFPDGTPLVQMYDVFAFDAERGEVTTWLLFYDAFGVATSGNWAAGQFSVVGDNRVVLEGMLTTGTFGATAYDTPPPEPPEASQSEFLTTLSGDRLRLHFGAADRDPGYPGDDAVHFRFDCPE